MTETLSTGMVTSQVISTSPAPGYKNPNDVVFNVKYPEGYKGPRHMPEGPTTVSKEVAEQFKKLGIGSVVSDKEEKTEAAGSAPSATDKVKATDLIDQINKAETAEAVDALIPEGEARTTVLAAVAARKAQISKPE